MNLRKYQDGDYEAIQDSVEPMTVQGDINLVKDLGVHLTATEGGSVVAVGGIIMTGDDEGEVWLKLSKNNLNKRILARILKEGYIILRDSFGLSRLTAKVQEGFCSGIRLATAFGFKPTDETIDISEYHYRIYEQWLTQ